MSRRYHPINHKIKVTSLAQPETKVNLARLAVLAAFTFYFFSFFFSSITWRAPVEG